MALTCEELIDEVKAAIGREEDTVLVTDARVLRFLNSAQEEIAEQCPGLTALDFKNTTSVDFTTVLKYALADFTSSLDDVTTENRVCHIYNAAYVDGNESVRLQFMPTDDFDQSYLDPTSSDFATGKPKYFTRRGDYLEVVPVCSSSEWDKDFGLFGSVYPVEFTATDSTETSSIRGADEMLIAYAIFKAWSYVGKVDNAKLWLDKFNMLLEDYKLKNNVLHEWDANIYGAYE